MSVIDLDLSSTVSGMFGAGLRSRRLIDYPVMQSSREDPEYYLRRALVEIYDINGVCSSRQTVFWENQKNLTI
ncbi:MAG: hypothetical protein ACLR9S_01835 [Lachnospiraceae bacterium]